MMTDAGHQIRLVLRAQAGDLEAAEELLREIQNALFLYLCRLVGRSDAEDVLQSVLMQIFRKLESLHDPELFRAWAYRISSRAAFAFLKRKRRWPDRFENEAILLDLPAPAREDIPDLFQEMPGLLDEISPGSRAVLLLHYFHDMTIEEVDEPQDIECRMLKNNVFCGSAFDILHFTTDWLASSFLRFAGLIGRWLCLCSSTRHSLQINGKAF